MSKKICISVIGSGGDKLTPQLAVIANEVGREIAKRGAVLICGGLDGVMAEAARGAKEQGGLTIGILPGEESGSANPFIDIALPTGLGFARNMLVAYSGDAIIAVGGRFGTLSEISYALIKKKPVIGIHTWNLEQLSGRMPFCGDQSYGERVLKCANAKGAVDAAFAIIENKEKCQNGSN